MPTIRNGAIRREWRWSGTRDGKRQSATFETEELADAAWKIVMERDRKVTRDELYRILAGEEVPVSKEPTSEVPRLGDPQFIHDFINLSNVRRASTTKESYMGHLNTEILGALGKYRLDEITQDQVADFITYLDRVKRTSATVTRYHATLHCLFEYAIDRNYIQRNPARPGAIGFKRDGIREFDISDTAMERRMYLTYDEFDLIAEHARLHARPLIELLVGSGVRISEAVALDIQDVDWSNGTVRVLKQVRDINDADATIDKSAPIPGLPGYAATKGRNRRTLSLEPRVLDWLKVAIDGRSAGRVPGDAPIFRSMRGAKWDYNNFLDRDWYPAVASAMRCRAHPPALPEKPKSGPTRKWRVNEVSECECTSRLRRRPTPHQLRHTHASWLLLEGYTMEQVSKRLGHSSVMVTDREYSHFLIEKDAEMAATLGAARTAALAGRK